MIVSQSFRVKNADGTFGEETKLSTISDLIFYSDNETLTKKTTDIKNSIAQEVTDRINAVSDLSAELKKEIDDDVEAARVVLQTSITANTNAINAINDGTNGLLAQAKGYSDSILTQANIYTDNQVSPVNALVQTNIANISSITDEMTKIVTLIGTPVEGEEPLLSILERLTAIEERLTILEGGTQV